MPTLLVLFSFTLLSLLYYVFKRKFSYWESKNVKHIKPYFLFGNFSEYISLRKYIGNVTQEICNTFSKEPYIGAYYGTEPALIVQDPELIKLVLTKDFYFFSGREVSSYTHKEVITQNLFFTYGDRWKVTRQNLTPLFSSAKMRNMFYLIEKCAFGLEKTLNLEATSGYVEVRSLMIRYAMDCISSCAFGVNTNTMGQVKDNPFKNMGDLIFQSTNYRGFKTVARAIWPSIFYGLGFKSFPTTIDTFFFKLLTGIFEARNYKATNRNDFIDLVLGLKANKYMVGDSLENMKTGAGKKVELEVNDDLLVAQCVMFFAAGFETSATTLSFTLYELAKNQEAQRRAQEDVDNYLKRHNNKLDYACVSELPYVEACIDEALRLYPVLPVLTREVVEDYTLPSGLRLEKGVRIHIPVYYLHHSEINYPDPNCYRPERFLGPEKKNVRQYTYMPFGEGPRICIGMRFAKMQMFAGLITLLKKYTLVLADDMLPEVELEPRAIVTQPVGGIRLKFQQRESWEDRIFSKSEKI
ncbi:hypothetical protein K1T71_011097 [Dendrolimus kikuchii]|uniref:Uncharacterized protein n=1 Tax=Dendrolimus kikuchii TaxID=765133 RepID=A0ACC1CMW1_9NEOP|nr:hypothetical protein K1T71_011097 [Dendrolimus kikuchii]